MSFDRHLLDIVCCPVTRQPLEAIPPELLARINAGIDSGTLKSAGDVALTEPLDEGLMTRDGRIGYPVRDGIPVLLEDYGIPLTQLD